MDDPLDTVAYDKRWAEWANEQPHLRCRGAATCTNEPVVLGYVFTDDYPWPLCWDCLVKPPAYGAVETFVAVRDPATGRWCPGWRWAQRWIDEWEARRERAPGDGRLR